MAKKRNAFHLWRRASQFFFLVALNPYIFLSRGICFPAMNCWACPAAAFGCPIGAIGNFLVKGIVPFFAIGVMFLLGALVGRLICGWVCPFGLIQDLMNRIPSPKFKIPKAFSYAKYAFLIVTVFWIPLQFGIDKTESGTAPSDFFFCNYCPAGTLEAAIPVKIFGSRFDGAGASIVADAGTPEGEGAETPGDEGIGGNEDESEDLFGGMEDEGEDLFGDESTGNPDLLGGAGDEDESWMSAEEQPETASAAGAGVSLEFFLSTRMWILYGFLALFVMSRRPFCRVVCPIGATFAILNRFSFMRMRVQKDQCKSCNACAKKCPVDNKVYFTPSSDDCIRCMECVKNCKRGGVKVGAIGVKAKETYWE